MIHLMTPRARKRTWVTASAVAAVLIWSLASRLVGREIILPAPEVALAYLWKMLAEEKTWAAVGRTMGRLAFSFSMNIAASLALGTLAGFFERIEYVLSPVIAVMKSVPTMGVILLSLIWFGSGKAVLFVCTLIVFPVLYGAVLTGIRHLDADLLEMHRVFRIKWTKTLRHFVLPSLRPHLIAGVMSGLGLSMKVIIAAEVLAQPKIGIGTMFQIERARLNTAGVFAWSLLVIFLTAFMDLLFSFFKKRYGRRP
jgi:NitT/TauT family transport system permease protein